MIETLLARCERALYYSLGMDKPWNPIQGGMFHNGLQVTVEGKRYDIEIKITESKW